MYFLISEFKTKKEILISIGTNINLLLKYSTFECQKKKMIKYQICYISQWFLNKNYIFKINNQIIVFI